MKLTELYPTRFVSGRELKRPIEIEIERIAFEGVFDRATNTSTRRLVIYPRRPDGQPARRGILVTKTIARQLATVFGDIDINDLAGQRITIYPQRHASGNIMICVRAAEVDEGDQQ